MHISIGILNLHFDKHTHIVLKKDIFHMMEALEIDII